MIMGGGFLIGEISQEICIKYQYTFSRNYMDLGRVATAKYVIVLTDPIPFKKR